MITLITATSKLVVELGEVLGTVQPVFNTAFYTNKADATDVVESSSIGSFNSTTKVDLVAAPSSTFNRNITDIIISNVDTIGHTFRIISDENGVFKTLFQFYLNPNETWSYPLIANQDLSGKEDAANKSNDVADIASTTKFPVWKVITDWAVGLFATITNLALKANIITPTFTTNITTPLIIGGTGTTQTLTYKTTSGVGATGARHIFQVGNNGATEAMTVLNNGDVGIGLATPVAKLDVKGSGNTFATLNLKLSNSDGTEIFTVQDHSIGKFTGQLQILGTGASRLYVADTASIIGKVGIGTTSPTAVLHIKAGTATASTGPLKLTAGTNTTTPEAGLFEFTNAETGLAFTAVSTRRNVVLDTATQTLTDKRITQRTATATSSATPTINTDSVDFYSLTAQTTAVAFAVSGTPTEAQQLWIAITGTAARAISWNGSFEAGAAALPTTTVTTARLDVLFIFNTANSLWRCMAQG